MGKKKQLVPYLKFSLIGGAKVLSSATQTKYGVDYASKIILRSDTNPARYGFVGLAMLAGFMVNTSLKLPLIHATYVTNYENNPSQPIVPYKFKNLLPQIFYHVSTAFAFTSIEINDALNSYFTAISLLDNVMANLGVNMHDELWKEIISQACGIALGAGIALANHPNDWRFAKENILEIAKTLDNSGCTFNRSVAQAGIFALPVMLGAPILSYFFTNPAIGTIPGAKFLLRDVGIMIVTGIFAAAAFFRMFAALPSFYSTFGNKNASNDRQSIAYPKNCKTSTVQFCAGFGGTFDSFASGLCMFAGVVVIATTLLRLSGGQEYSWELMVAATIFAMSQMLQNAVFSIYKGYQGTMDYLYSPKAHMYQPLLTAVEEVEDVEDGLVSTSSSSHNNSSASDLILRSSSSVLFRPKSTTNNSSTPPNTPSTSFNPFKTHGAQ